MSVARIATFFLSWLGALLFSPSLASFLDSRFGLSGMMMNYIEVSDKIVNQEIAKQSIAGLSADKISEALTSMGMPESIRSITETNITEKVFEGSSVTTLADYVDRTIINIVLNAGTFLILFLIFILLFAFITGVVRNVVRIPVLRTFDSLLGALFGLVWGIMLVSVIYIMAPVAVAALPIQQVGDLFRDSWISGMFYESGFLNNIYSGLLH